MDTFPPTTSQRTKAMNLNLAYETGTTRTDWRDGGYSLITLMGAVKVIREYSADGTFEQESIVHNTECYPYEGYWNKAENAEYVRCFSDTIGTWNVRNWVLAHV